MVKVLKPKKHSFDYKKNKNKTPTKDDYDVVINYDCDIYDGDKVVCSYRKLDNETRLLLKACANKAKTTKSNRTLGVSQESAVFGALPRVACREDYCRFSADTKKQPEVFSALKTVGLKLWGVYKETYPEVAEKFVGFTNKINKDWLKTNTPFTTVNVNKNFAIGYHLDNANYGDVYSNVLISKYNAKGGYFVMPEYRVALAQDDGALVIVDGANIPHGVTKIEPTQKDWNRSSIVFYTLANLQHCYSQADEIKRSKAITTERARKRSKGVDPRGQT